MKRAAILLVLGAASGLMAQEYAGPALLSRGLAPTGSSTPQLDFRPYVMLTSSLGNGLNGAPVAANGQATEATSLSEDLAMGLYGYHSWKHTLIGLDYKGDFRRSNPSSSYDTSNQQISLGVTHHPSRHTTLTLREAAGLFSQNYGQYYSSYIYDPQQSILPAPGLLDSRTLFLDTQADFTYTRSARLSFNASAEGFLVRRRATSLDGVTGTSLHGDTAYRLSRNSTLAVQYSFTQFGFMKTFGESTLNGCGLEYSRRLTRHWEVALRGGGMRVESENLALVAVPADIARVTGRTTGVKAAYELNYAPNAQARLVRLLRRGSLEVSYSRSVTPGNGAFLTSRQDDASATLAYTAFRRWNLSGNFGRYDSITLIGTSAHYSGYRGGFGITRPLQKGFHWVGRFDVTQYDTQALPQTTLNRLLYAVSIGFGWSPGDTPLSLW